MRRHSSRPHLWAIGVPLLFLIMVGGAMPIAQNFAFDPDEGIELVKVVLYNQGYTLYDQIWNDQPPLLTLALASWLKVFGPSIVAARLLTTVFATILVSAFLGSLRLCVGLGPALLGTLGLCLTMNFLRLSVSVMRGIPALALAMVAIYLLLRVTSSQTQPERDQHRQPIVPLPTLSVLASGICFGLALQFKFYILMLLPACLLHLVCGITGQDRWPFKAPPKRRWWAGLLWLVACGGTTLWVGLLTRMWDWQQLMGAHFHQTAQSLMEHKPGWQVLLTFLVQDFDYSLLAAVGTWRLFKQHHHWPLLPLVWLVTVWLALMFYRPLWYHYYPMLSLPITWLAVYGITPCTPWWQEWRQRQQQRKSVQTVSPSPPSPRSPLAKLTARLVVLSIALAPIKVAITGVKSYFFVKDSAGAFALVRHMQAFGPQTRWVVTDLPMLAFHAQLKVPPELVVFSSKRIGSGNLSPAYILQVMERYTPEQVVFSPERYQQPLLKAYLDRHYVPHYKSGTITQYVLKSLPSRSRSFLP